MLELVPLHFRQASAFVEQHHRHHKPPAGHKFSIGCQLAGRLVGVVIIGRPVSRMLDDGLTAEVLRCCTDGTANVCSKLYAAAWRAARAMGYRRLITYTLIDEPGTSLRAAGWTALYQTKGGSWDCPSRPRVDKHPTAQKRLWCVDA